MMRLGFGVKIPSRQRLQRAVPNRPACAFTSPLKAALRRRLCYALIACGLGANGAALAVDADGARATLGRITNEIAAQEAEVRARQADAARLTDELAQLRAEQIAVARSAQEQEADIAAIEQTLGKLAVEAAIGRAALESRIAATSGAATALVRLARRPAYAALVMPGEPTDLLRGGLLLRAALPQLESQAAQLRGAIAKLATN